MIKYIEDAFRDYVYEVIFVDDNGEERLSLRCYTSEQFMWAMKLAFQNGLSVYIDAWNRRAE